MKDFFRNPEKTNYTLSPNGEYFAFMMPWKYRLNLFVQKIGSKEVSRITGETTRDVAEYCWVNNERIVYVKDNAGDENFRLFSVSLDGSKLVDLTPFEKVTVQIIDELEENEEEMIIAMNNRDSSVFDVYRLNAITGNMNLIAENPGNITGWLTDHEGKLRVAMTTDGVNTSLLFRKTENDEFKIIKTCNFKESLLPLMFTFDNKLIYAKSNIGRDKSAIVKYDIENNKELEVIFEHPEVDVDDLVSSKKRKIITGISFTTDKKNYVFFDKKREKLHNQLQDKLPGYEVVVADWNKNEDKILVRTFNDKSRGSYYFFNMQNGEFFKLTDVSPWLDEKLMAETKPIEFQSRDGIIIHGYLTLPQNKNSEKLPVVVNPHGGPWVRDTWGFNPEVQFLANRGYAILQINYRGSTGYGRKFWEMSFKQWGKKMQNDITDGVNWLIEKGIADKNRVGIYGGSYGGYAVLAGLSFTPDLYACGVDNVGISNLFTFMKSIPPYWKPYIEMFYEMVGDPDKDKDLLKETSPIFHVDKMKAPLLIAQGANDPRVAKSESDQMVEALKKRGIDVPYLVKDNEGHGFNNEENRFEFYRAMEEFFGKYLGGKVEDKP
ncbi:MAG TPA: S9 family peptidase [Ignavibacteriaceae bacterium]|nr:S9 family peptidase [Ignavibacteriaceae bacterium]